MTLKDSLGKAGGGREKEGRDEGGKRGNGWGEVGVEIGNSTPPICTVVRLPFVRQYF